MIHRGFRGFEIKIDSQRTVQKLRFSLSRRLVLTVGDLYWYE